MKTGNKITEEYTIGTGRAHLYILLLLFPVLIIYAGIFLLIWDTAMLSPGLNFFVAYFIPVIIPGVILHELLHGISWSFFTKRGFKSIKFGIQWRYLAPYCHCKEPLKARHYLTGALMPFLVLGLLPALLAFLTGNSILLFFGIIFTWTAGGDLISVFMLFRLDPDTFIQDHPDKLGFYTVSGSSYS